MKDNFYSVQMEVDGFGHDTATMICFHTEKECEKWIEKNAARISKNIGRLANFTIVEQTFGTEYEETWG